MKPGQLQRMYERARRRITATRHRAELAEKGARLLARELAGIASVKSELVEGLLHYMRGNRDMALGLLASYAFHCSRELSEDAFVRYRFDRWIEATELIEGLPPWA